MVDLLSTREGVVVVHSPEELGVLRVDSDVTEINEGFAVVVAVEYLIDGSDFIEAELVLVFADKLCSNWLCK